MKAIHWDVEQQDFFAIKCTSTSKDSLMCDEALERTNQQKIHVRYFPN